jgi:predicted nuclease of predicted toxin-antitoxin system
MKGASDEEIIQKAIEEDRVIITNDKHFGRLAESHKRPGIILLRLKDESVKNKVKVISFGVTSHGKAVLRNVMVVSETKNKGAANKKGQKSMRALVQPKQNCKSRPYRTKHRTPQALNESFLRWYPR